MRNIVFELCGSVPAFQAFVNLPSCGWYFTKSNGALGNTFTTLQMMRDADDVGEPNPNPTRPCHGSISKKRDCSTRSSHYSPT